MNYNKIDKKLEKIKKLIDEDSISFRVVLCSSFETYLKTMFFLVNEKEITIKPFHKTVIKKLEDIVFGRVKKRNLMLNLPVGSGKSLLVEYFISWCFARDINNAFIYTSSNDRLIMKLSAETKEICSSEYWRKIFGGEYKADSKVNWSFKNAKNRTGLTAGTIGGATTGLDAGNPITDGFSGALIIDDPLDAGKARYEGARKEVIDFYTQKLATRRRTPQTPTILVMQRLHLEDLAGYIEEVEPEEWEIVKVKAVNDGVSFWEERYPMKEMNRLARVNPFLFNGQYQQSPIQSGGSVIKTEWFKYYATIEGLKFTKLFFTADTAQKIKEHNDWSVFSFWGVFDNRLYWLDMLRGKWEAPELKKMGKVFWEKWKNGVNNRRTSLMYIEDKVSGTGLIQEFQRENQVRVKAIQRDRDKLIRCEDALPYIECGQVLLPIDKSYGFCPLVLSEAEAFRRDNTHVHDDILDTLFDAVEIGLAKRKPSILDVI